MSLVEVSSLAEGAARFTLNRPDKRNALSPEMADDFRRAVESAVGSGVRAVLLEAAGPVFCAGADTRDIHAGHGALNEMLDVMLAEPLHWTALVTRPALGAGLALLGACPTVLATGGATFAMPEMRSGFFPSALIAGQQSLVGARAAYDLAFGARPISAARGMEIGLVTRLCAEEDAEQQAREAVVEVAGRSAEAVIEGVRLWQGLMRPQLLP